MVVGSFT